MKYGCRFFIAMAAALPWWTAQAAEPMGRLFFTPPQRSALDAGKKIGVPRSARAPAAPRGPREVTLNGVVTRSDGESTVWVNGRALDSKPLSGVSVSASGSDPAAARVKLRGKRGTVELRVGQRLERTTSTIAEPYEAVAVSRESPTPIANDKGTATSKEQAPSNSETPADQSSDD
jgi:hypothetical protein